MKITQMEVFPIVMEQKIFVLLGSGRMHKKKKATIIKLYTDEDIIGLGELSQMDESILNDLVHIVSPIIIGKDPFNRECIVKKVYEVMMHLKKGRLGRFMQAAIDEALYDILGKKLEVSIYNLLGGSCRKEIPVTWVVGIKNLEETAKEVSEAVAKGFNVIKCKVGIDIKADIERVKIIREIIPSDGKIRIDPNEAWDPKTAIRNIKKLDNYELELVEQPVPAWNINGLAMVTHAVDVPILADESVWSPIDAIKIIEEKAADMINIYIDKAGGISNAMKIVSIAEAAGMPCILGSSLELGVGTSAGAHLAAAAQNICYNCDIIGPLYVAHDLLKEPMRYEKGFLKVPEGFGLGVELNEEEVNRYLDTTLFSKFQ